MTTSSPHSTRTHLRHRPTSGSQLLLAAVSGTALVSLLARLVGA